MITFLVVGRNDYYGINLHKRTAISLNYFGALCSEENDEIVYVDCNTPAQELTLAEAIADTLTPETRRRLRVFRITGEQMQMALGDTPLKFSDELARNVGIRRSNPKNFWLLSTNCDILVFPLSAATLGAVIRKLEPRFYLCPRLSIPFGQWQQLDRQSVGKINELGEAVLRQGTRPPPEKADWLRFASVGDFQLAPRAQWLEIGGCEEGMKLWGHSDANNARRLNILNGGGRTPDLADHLAILHLDHNPTEGVAHEKIMQHNDYRTWVEDITNPHSRNKEDWGMRDVVIPELRISKDLAKTRDILKSQPRERRLWKRLKTRLMTKFWRKVGGWVNQIEGQKS